MSGLDIEGVLATHRLRGRMLSDTEADCTCGGWLGDLAEAPFEAHVAAVLREQIAAWLGGEAQRRDRGSVWWRIQHYGPLDAKPFEFSRFESPAHAALSPLVAQVAPPTDGRDA